MSDLATLQRLLGVQPPTTGTVIRTEHGVAVIQTATGPRRVPIGADSYAPGDRVRITGDTITGRLSASPKQVVV